MAIQGSYKINYTDPKNGSFVIEPYTVNGTVTPTSDVLHPKATKANTSLLLPGQYVPNYGELIIESLLHLLEHFAGDTPPALPVEGQLWYDTGDSYDIVDLTSTGCVLSGNQSAKFSAYIAGDVTLTAWYGPVSVNDNSYSAVEFKVTSVLVNGGNNTVITTVDPLSGAPLNLPNTVVGGFVTPNASSRLGRLKVSTVVNNELTWADVVNVNCSASAPVTEHIQNGDLWYDLTSSQLKINIEGVWQSLTAAYLPLTGGTLTGTLDMGIHPVLFSGDVTTGTTLTNKLYVDQAILDAVGPLESNTNAAISVLQTRVTSVEASVQNKVTKTGDNFNGALVFGPDGTTTTMSMGIDMRNSPIVNPSITWSSLDYLNATGETHNVVDKNYVALSLKQHLIDAIHADRLFIEDQPDGSGKAVGSLFFADVSNTLSFNVNNTSYGLAVDTDSLIVYTGSWVGSTISFQQVDNATPLLELSDSEHTSNRSLHLLDGQPQPTFNGAVTDINEDTKAATKGYVLDAIQTVAAPITDANFDYSVETGPYNVSLVRPGTSDIVVDINHEHKSEKIIHDYEQLVGWAGGKEDLVGTALGNPDQISINHLLNALNQLKAPTSGAIFKDAPVSGTSGAVQGIDAASGGFSVQPTLVSSLYPGLEVTLFWMDSGSLVANTYMINGSVLVPNPLGGADITYFTTLPALPVGHDLVNKPMTCLIPIVASDTDVRELVTVAGAKKIIRTYMTSIKDFGAVGDGVTDCALALLAAKAATTGTVTVPAGNFVATLTTSNSAQILDLLARIKIEGSLTLNLAAGTHTFTAPVRMFSSGISVNGLKIIGAAPTSVAITSQVSVTGSAGAYSVVLGVSTVTGVAVGDFIHTWTVVGTGSPEVHRGVWEITAVDVANTRITVKNTCRKATFPTNTITTSNSVVLKTMLKFDNCDGFVVTGGRIDLLNNVAIVGNSDSYWSSSNVSGTEKGTHGLTIGSMTIALNGKPDNANQYGVTPGHVSCGPYVGVSGFDQQGVVTELGGTFWGDFVSACNNKRRGFYASTSSGIRAKHISANGNFLDGVIVDIGGNIYASSSSCAVGNGGRGVSATQSGSIIFDSAIVSHNVGDGGAGLYSGILQATGARFEFNGGNGALAEYSGVLVINDSTFLSNTRYGIDASFSSAARASNSTFTSNGIYGVRATESATVVVTGSTFTTNVSGDKTARAEGNILDGSAYTPSSKIATDLRIMQATTTRGTQLATTSDGTDFIISHDTVGSGTYTATLHVKSATGGVHTEADNTVQLGRASNRWSTVYAGTGTINTSDEDSKFNITTVDDLLLDAWADVEYAQYKFIDAVELKGEADARIHVGVIAQRVKSAFDAKGLDAFAYGLLCYDEWEATSEVLDEAGNVLQGAVEAGSRYGVRYEEALALEAALMRRTTKDLQAQIDALKAQLSN